MNAPGPVEVYGRYRKHLGPRYEAAGLGIQFHYNQAPGVSFRVEPPGQYRGAILRGIADGMTERFPDFPSSGSIWIIEISEDEIDSSEQAFYRAARMVVDQAFALTESAKT
jgi:hypothetical protein